jgi:hypothetical protein
MKLAFLTDLLAFRSSKDTVLTPITISRNEQERVLIETSINSVRINIQIRQSDYIEQLICRKFMRFLMQRAEPFLILRRKPLPVMILTIIINNLIFIPKIF